MDVPQFVDPIIFYEHFGSFPSLMIINKTATNIHMQAFVWT